jgi:hypothetical protein
LIDFQRTWWPPDADTVRLQNYQLTQQLFESNHAAAFKERSAKVPPHLKSKNYIGLDYPKLISVTFADLLYGAAPIFSLPSQQSRIDNLVLTNNLPILLYESELSASFRGDAVYKLCLERRNAGGPLEVLIEEVPAYSYFVEIDPDNGRRVLSQALAWERTVGDGEYTKRYLRVERHLPGKIQNELYEIKGLTKVSARVPLSVLYGDQAPPDEELTRVNVPLLFHVPNERHGSVYWGESDYTKSLIDLFDEANNRVTTISDILDKHSDPKLVTSPGTVDRFGRIRSSELQVIEATPEDTVAGTPRYLTWDAQLQSAFGELESIEKKIFKFAHISKALFPDDNVGHIDSGRAMAMLFADMLTRVRRKQSYREPVIKALLYTAMQLEAAWLGQPKPDGYCEVIWRNGLPKDDLELTNVAVAAVGAKIMSRYSAIRYTRQVGDEEARAELERIDLEQDDDAMDAAQLTGGQADVDQAEPPGGPDPNEPNEPADGGESSGDYD